MRLLPGLIPALLLILMSACESDGGASAGHRANDPVPQLRREGRWLVDAQNRVVLLHGVNLVWKLAPYVPPETAEGFLDADARWLAENGFNSARLGTLWVGISPQASGEVRADYLAAWDRVVQRLAQQRIWMLFDFHQDLLGPLYGGEGVPEWAVESLRGPTTALLGPPTFGFPFNYFTPQVSEAFDTLWAERGPVRDGFRDAWIAVARQWRDQPYSMGYDLMNEPWAGLEYPTCLVPLTGCTAHDSASLQPFFEHARAGIRGVDAHNLVWFQSQPLTSSGAPTGFSAVPGESQLGYSFHYYCPLTTLANAAQLGLIDDALPLSLSQTCDAFGPRVFDEARAQADRMNGVELLTEFGATDRLDVLNQVADLADQRLVGWQYWAYKNWRDPTTESQTSGGQSLFARDDDLASVKLDKLRVLSRCYPQATAGIPLELSFDPDSGAFSYRYTPRAAGGPTEIYVPVALHYPRGYAVSVSGARVVSAPDASPLLLENSAGSTQVQVQISRR